jgi:hypothetical protein
VVVDEIDVLECDIFISCIIFYCFFLSLQYLSSVGSSFDVIALIDLQFHIEDVADDDEVDGAVAAFIFHLV